MEVQLNALHLFVASLASCLPAILFLRPLYSLLICWRFRNTEVLFKWKEPRKIWLKRIKQKRVFVHTLLAASLLALAWTTFTKLHEAYVALSISSILLFIGLAIELLFPPTYKITKNGLVIQTLDTMSLLFVSPKRNDRYFVSWKRVISVRLDKTFLRLMYLANPRSSYELLWDPLRHSIKVAIPVPKGKRQDIFEFAMKKTEPLRSKIRLRRSSRS